MVGSGLKRRAYYVLALLLLAPVVVTGALLMKGRDAKLSTSSSLLGRERRVAEHQLLTTELSAISYQLSAISSPLPGCQTPQRP